MKSILARGFSENLKEFASGEALTSLSKSDQVKAEFLLLTLPLFYNGLVENLRMKESYSYRDILRQVQLYVPGRQQGG